MWSEVEWKGVGGREKGGRNDGKGRGGMEWRKKGRVRKRGIRRVRVTLKLPFPSYLSLRQALDGKCCDF